MIKRAYNFSTKLYAIEQIKAYDDAQRLNFNLDCQRGHVWTESQKQGLIDTLMFQERIPEVHAIKDSNSRIFNIADGKQRLSTILDFLNNRLSWKKSYADSTFYSLFGEKNKLFFYELPMEYQNSILSIEISFATYEIINDAGIIKLFKKLNSGSPLNNFQKGIASNIQLRTNFSNRILNNPNIQKIFSQKLIEKDRVEEFCIDILVSFLSIDQHDGDMVPVSLNAEDVFNYETSYLKDGLSLDEDEMDKWTRTLSEKAQLINYCIDVLSQVPMDKPIKSKSQFIFPVLYWYVYNLSDEDFISLFNETFYLNPASVVGAGSNYNVSNMRKWINKINSILF